MSSDKAQANVAQWALQHQMIPEQLDPLADQIRDDYVQRRRMMYPGYKLNKMKYDSTFWRRVAIIVTEAKMDPKVYVAMTFHTYKSKAYETCLLSPNIQFAYNVEEVDTLLVENIQADLEASYARLELYKNSTKEPLATLLQDRSICPSDVFVWCLAKSKGLDDVAAPREGRARALLLRPAYRRIYSQVFPEVVNGDT